MGYDKEIVLSFLDEVSEYIPQLQRHLQTLSVKPKSRESLEECYRLAHSIKGSASMLELEEMRQEGYAIEHTLFPYYEKRETFTPNLVQTLTAHVNNIEQLIQKSRDELETPEPATPYYEPMEFSDQPTYPGMAAAAYNNPPTSSFSIPNPVTPIPRSTPPPDQSLEDLMRELGPNKQNGNGVVMPPAPSQPQAQTASAADEWLNSPLFDLVFDELDLPPAGATSESPSIEDVRTQNAAANFPYPFPAFEPDEASDNDLSFEEMVTRGPEVSPNSGWGSSQASFSLSDFQSDLGNLSTPPHKLDSTTPPWLRSPVNLPDSGQGANKSEINLDFEPLSVELSGLDDILSTNMVDQQVSRLQDEILPLIPDNMAQFEVVPMSGRIVMSDADLLATLGQDITASDTRIRDTLGSDIHTSQFDFAHEKLNDFADAADLLSGLEPENEATLSTFSGNSMPAIPKFEDWSAKVTNPSQIEAAEELKNSLEKDLPTEKPLLGMTAEEEAAVEAAIAAMHEGGELDLSAYGDLTDEEAAALAALNEENEAEIDFGFDPGPLFLAEAQSDLDKLVELINNFGPESVEDGSIRKIQDKASTMRKAAEMMGLPLVSRQLNIIESLADLLQTGELKPEPQAGEMLKNSLEDLQFLLEPYRDGAQALLSPPVPESAPTTSPEDFTTEEEDFESALPFDFATAPEPPTHSFYTPPPFAQPSSPPTGVEVDAELAEIFATEAEEHIQDLDTRLAALERNPGNRELVREIRRTAHTLKGSAAMVGFNVISQTGHLMEDLLDKLYDGTMQVNEDVVQLLFTTFNAMDVNVRGLAAGQPENPRLLDELRPRYAEILSGQGQEEEAEENLGGAIIFERKHAPVAPQLEEPAPVEARTVSDEDIAAIEALQAQQAAAEQAEANATAAMAVTQTTTSTGPIEVELGVRVPIKRLNEMMNQVGEMVINRTVLEQRGNILNRSVEEFTLSLRRLQRVARELETRYEVELLKTSDIGAAGTPKNGEFERLYGNKSENGKDTYAGEFDTLEMDRYTEFHQLSREMSETVADLGTIQREMENLRNEVENVTVQQGRITDDLQDKLVKVRLVPLSNLTPRLYRTVRTIAANQAKEVQFVVQGENTQVDKTIFEEIGDPLLHLIRNAIDHGVEPPGVRISMGKPRQATITFAARTEGTQVVIEVSDDGRGIDTQMLLHKGIEKGFVKGDTILSEEEIYNLMFLPGFSTSVTISEISGRGVGLDVVRANIADLKGVIEVSSEPGKGTTFSIRLPSTLTITRAVLMRSQGYSYAIPLSVVGRTTRLDAGVIERFNGRPYFRLDGENQSLPLLNLSELLRLPAHLRRNVQDDDHERTQTEQPILFISGPDRCALQVDTLIGQQEVVIKDLGTHLKAMPGLLGSTILGSGQVILILNIYELLRSSANRSSYASGYVSPPGARSRPDVKAGPEVVRRARTTGSLGNSPSEVFRQRRAPLIQVVDDSLSVRKVLSGMLEKSGFRVRTSKDGQEALEIIQQQSAPDLIIMDIEMPRMDGYELTTLLKSSPLYQAVPIIMLTSRAGLKHRQKAEEVGADGFLVKPYKEEELLQIVSALLLQSRAGSEA